MKCKVCGKRFVPDSKLVYQVIGGVPMARVISSSRAIYDAMDCPRCGCQQVLTERIPKVVKGGAEDDN